MYDALGIPPETSGEAFTRLDRNGSGEISNAEFRQALFEYYLSADENAPGSWLLGAPVASHVGPATGPVASARARRTHAVDIASTRPAVADRPSAVFSTCRGQDSYPAGSVSRSQVICGAGRGRELG